MAEWSIAVVLKTIEVRASGGSNPSLSAKWNTYRVSNPYVRNSVGVLSYISVFKAILIKNDTFFDDIVL